MRVLVLGASGMAGHMVTVYLTERGHEVTAFSRRPLDFCRNVIYGDVLDEEKIREAILGNSYDAVVNCTGILNNLAEENKPNAVLLNSYLPHMLAFIVKNTETRLIQMSTDCVFSGSKGGYHEKSLKDGESFYDRTKALGEVDDNHNLTFRTSIIGPDTNENGIGLFNWFMKQSEVIKGFSRAIWTGVTTLTLAKAIEAAMEQRITGLYHLVNNKSISKYELLKLFNQSFKDYKIGIHMDDRLRVDKSLVNTRNDFDFVVPEYDVMVSQMREWIYAHKELYPHYFR